MASGTAKLIGDARGRVHSGTATFEFNGAAELYECTPPLFGYTTVAASTISAAPHLTSSPDMSVEFGVETYIFGLDGDDLQINHDELANSGWGETAESAFAAVGYVIVR